MEKASYDYILASAPYGTLYTGATTHLVQRTWQHKEEVFEGFTKKYGVHILVWYEVHADIMDAALREKQIKHWKRAWKLRLISASNPGWRDLYDDFCG
jgi:putative endonuclease